MALGTDDTLGRVAGSGVFTTVAAGTYSFIGNAEDMTLVDVNNDGKSDAITQNNGGQVLVSLGNGDGTFATSTAANSSFGAVNSYKTLSTSDLNNDGNVDIVFKSVDTNSDAADSSIYRVLLGDGTGSFTVANSFSAWGRSRLVLGDLDGDNVVDAVSVSLHGVVQTYKGHGGGQFAKVNEISGQGELDGLDLADINGDGKLDAVAPGASGGYRVLIGEGNGKFSSSSAGAAGPANDIRIGDVNNDGKNDLVLANVGQAYINIALGRGDGTFNAVSSYGLSVTTGFRINNSNLADLNDDGNLDFSAASANGNSVTIAFGQGDGSFAGQISYASAFAIHSAVGDINGDGTLDIVTAPYAPGSSITALLNVTDPSRRVLKQKAFNLNTVYDARTALRQLGETLSNVNQQRSKIGSLQSRLSSANANLTTTVTNLQSARSRIVDTDVASDSSQLVRLGILKQASAAVLAQANVQPALALKLLQS